jgi:hypothetical protein
MTKTATSGRRKPNQTKRWSARVPRSRDALDLESKVFAKKTPREIARSLKRSAERSHRRTSSPYRSAMSMPTFYINRAGKKLPKSRLHVLQRAKGELRKAFDRE